MTEVQTEQTDIIPPGEVTPQPTSLPWVELLQADTPEEEIHKRAATRKDGSPIMRNGAPLVLDYVTARFVQDRLDSAVGPLNWQSTFESLPSGAVRCGIGIRMPGSIEWVWKWDVGIPSSIEPDKGAHSDAFKRAGVQWGIARDLYDERDEDRDPQPVAANPQGTIREQVAQPQVAQPMAQPQQQPIQMQPGMEQVPNSNIVEYDERAQQGPVAQGAAWVCPLHGTYKVVPAGISKRTNKPYDAFLACNVPGCDEKQPFQRR